MMRPPPFLVAAALLALLLVAHTARAADGDNGDGAYSSEDIIQLLEDDPDTGRDMVPPHSQPEWAKQQLAAPGLRRPAAAAAVGRYAAAAGGSILRALAPSWYACGSGRDPRSLAAGTC
jgi:hypothetical protein